MQFVALLRSVNLAATKRLKMADLRECVERLGYGAVRTVAHTGNILFEADGKVPALEQAIHAAVAKRFGFHTEVFVRSAAGMRRLVADNPFPTYAQADPAHLVALVMRAPPPAAGVEAARASIKGREEIAAAGPNVYLWYPDGIGTSKFTGVSIERRLGALGTARNWNTIDKIIAALRVGQQENDHG